MIEEAKNASKYDARTLEEIIEVGDSRNCNTVVATDTQLMLDIDTTEQMTQYIENWPLVKEKYPQAEIEDSWSSRNKGTHIVIEVGETLPKLEQLALQAALGSDPKRTIIALWELRRCGTTVINLFRPREGK